MMEKFNFYDIYGYLVPGGVLLALLWLPFAGNMSTSPSISPWAGAALAIVTAYIAGHLVQTIAVVALPSSVREKDASAQGSGAGREKATMAEKVKRRQPSNMVLDAGQSELVLRVAHLVKESFQIELRVGRVENERDKKDVDRRRGDAFLLCRAALVEAKAGSYVEQFEGMYTLMRGLSLVFYFGTAYMAGWALAPFDFGYSRTIAGVATIVFIALGVCFSFAAAPIGGRYVSSGRQELLGGWAAIWVGAALLALGDYLGVICGSSLHQQVYLPVALVTLFCGFRCFTTYHRFTWTYANEVWRAFVAHHSPLAATPSKG